MVHFIISTLFQSSKIYLKALKVRQEELKTVTVVKQTPSTLPFYSVILSQCCSRSWTSLVTQTVKNPLAIKDTQVYPWIREIPQRREWQPTPVFLPRESHGQRGLQTVGHEWSTQQITALTTRIAPPFLTGKLYTPIYYHVTESVFLQVGYTLCTTDIKVGHVICSGQQHEQCSRVMILSRTFIRQDIFLPALSLSPCHEGMSHTGANSNLDSRIRKVNI